MADYTMGEMDRMEYAPEMVEESKCPECNGIGYIEGPPWHPCPFCLSARLRGEKHKGMMDTAYKSIMPELRPNG